MFFFKLHEAGLVLFFINKKKKGKKGEDIVDAEMAASWPHKIAHK